ncbi:MAG TPA: hypothetical protein VKT82_24815 [Ktedonobacterales bacterium]|nr:hypothetical protein [Ktedonobacterales bacterium]
MAENICLMVADGSEYINSLIRAIELGAAAADLYQRKVIYLDKSWNRFARAGAFEKEKNLRESMPKLRAFLDAGGQLWFAPSGIGQEPLMAGAVAVDDRTLLAFLRQDTVVLTF